MSRPATEAQLDYLEQLRVWLSCYSTEAAQLADEIAGGDELTIDEASDAIEEMLSALDEARENRRQVKMSAKMI